MPQSTDRSRRVHLFRLPSAACRWLFLCSLVLPLAGRADEAVPFKLQAALIQKILMWDRTLEGQEGKAPVAILYGDDSTGDSEKLEAAFKDVGLVAKRVKASALDEFLRKPFHPYELRGRLYAATRILTLHARSLRYGQRYCIAVCDIDQFKAYNDTLGHAVGDQVLALVGERIVRSTSPRALGGIASASPPPTGRGC